MPFKKRRIQKSHNKNLKKVMRGQSEAVILGTRYANVQRLDIQLDFISPEGVLLSSENRSFTPNDPMDLTADCPGRCGNGRMDLEGKINQIINSGQVSCDTQGLCQEIIYADMKEVCGTQLRG